jgi:hypothetical protein
MKHQFGWDLPPGVSVKDIEDAQEDEIEDCVTCRHPFTLHVKGDFNGCAEPNCTCGCYWDSEDRALANAD